MPRSILGTPVTRDVAVGSGTRQTIGSGGGTRLAAPQLAMRLRQKRSARYVERMQRLDASSHTHDRAALDQLLGEIGAEFPELTIDQRPLGIVARCYLGPPYEVHMCDLGGSIIEHFRPSDPMPAPHERARNLAAHGAYAFIEVYADSLRAISGDGSVAVI